MVLKVNGNTSMGDNCYQINLSPISFGASLKRENFLHSGANSSIQEKLSFGSTSLSEEENIKSQKLFLFINLAEKIWRYSNTL